MSQKTTRRSPKRPPHKKRKRQYRIRNWKEYNQALKQRGSLTCWIDAGALAGWCCQKKSGKPGASDTYSESAIVCALTLQAVYHLPLRATEGLLRSWWQVLTLALPVPDYSTLCKRRMQAPPTLDGTLAPVSEVHSFASGGGCDRLQSLWRRRVESAPARVE